MSLFAEPNLLCQTLTLKPVEAPSDYDIATCISDFPNVQMRTIDCRRAALRVWLRACLEADAEHFSSHLQIAVQQLHQLSTAMRALDMYPFVSAVVEPCDEAYQLLESDVVAKGLVDTLRPFQPISNQQMGGGRTFHSRAGMAASNSGLWRQLSRCPCLHSRSHGFAISSCCAQ